MPCAYTSLGLKKPQWIVNHQASSKRFDAISINFTSCSSCFAQKCNFIHAANISLHNSQGKHKVAHSMCSIDESTKIGPTVFLPLSRLIIYTVHVSSAVTTLHHHIRCSFIPQSLAHWKGESMHFKKWNGSGTSWKKTTEDTVKGKGCRAWVGHKDELWGNVAALLDKGSMQREEQAKSSTQGKAGTDNTAVEIHLQSPLKAAQKVHSRLTVERCSLIHSL